MELPTWGKAPYACEIVYALLEITPGFPKRLQQQKHPFLKNSVVNSLWVGEREFNLNQIPEKFQERKGVGKAAVSGISTQCRQPKDLGHKKAPGKFAAKQWG